jgi:hypothetical protein
MYPTQIEQRTALILKVADTFSKVRHVLEHCAAHPELLTHDSWQSMADTVRCAADIMDSMNTLAWQDHWYEDGDSTTTVLH